MTPKERIEFIVDNCTGGSLKKFSEATGIDVSVACRLRSGELGNSDKEGLGRFAERIYRAFPELNAAWLLTGDGEPFAGRKVSRGIVSRIEALEKALARISKETGCPIQ